MAGFDNAFIEGKILLEELVYSFADKDQLFYLI